MSAARTTEITVALHHATRDAVKVSDTGEEAKARWLPKSKIEIVETRKRTRGCDRDNQSVLLPLVTITLPEWLAIREGFE